MADSLERKIRTAEQLARNCDMEAALAVAAEIVESDPQDVRVWALRAYIYELMLHYAEAREDLSRAIELSSAAPQLHYARGRMAYLLGDLESAQADFTAALDLINAEGSDDNRQELHFWRAAARVGLSDTQGAVDDLSHVNDGFATWTNGLLTKADLLAECG